MVEKHAEMEKASPSTLAEKARDNCRLFVQRHLLTYLLDDEKKHDLLLGQLEDFKRNLYPYTRTQLGRVKGLWERTMGLSKRSQKTGNQGGSFHRHGDQPFAAGLRAESAALQLRMPLRHRHPRLAHHHRAQADAYGRTSEDAYRLAWEKITERNPFPAVCGRVCPHPCEDACNRTQKDGPLAVNAMEQFVGDFGIWPKAC